MKSFCQFVDEATHQEEFKAWWFPNATQPTMVPADKHHVTALSVAGTDVGDRIVKALKMGYVRFGILADGNCYFHYDKRSTTSRKGALSVLDYLDPQPGNSIHVEDDPGTGGGYSYNTKGEAARHVRETTAVEPAPEQPKPEPVKKPKPVMAKIKPGESYQSLSTRAEAASKKAASVEKANKAYPMGYQMTTADWEARRARAEKEKQAHGLAAQLHGAARDLATSYDKREYHDTRHTDHRRSAARF